MFDIRQRAASENDGPVALLLDVETATLGHILTGGFMAPSIQRLNDDGRICGPALTVSVPPDDGVILGHAMTLARPGDVVVIDRQGDERHACWGAVMTAAALAAGVAGVIIDGFVTDVAAIRAAGLPVWCRGRSPLTTKLLGRGGSIHADVTCGGVRVRSGDLILADESGVCVLGPSEALELAEKALAMQATEPGIIARLAAGERIDEINGSRALIEQARATGTAES
ncbi:RraA family protein [Bosea lathyri]|uniref:Putative 4-hydroxy-4-methyl-2-oxoglutarate aldolase n=1 Tax=Bosea lathyri TaxID=1036778 RepID=A0A1H5VNP4_9HYPH|nr:dimethylmenaquinone methyltransferase [Bosea lathyri]SEF88441.1 Regulator of RNase E activity RraA [Bosea lathyri]